MSHIGHHSPAPTISGARAAGDVVDRHRHDEHQLVYVSAGVIAIRTEQGAWVASPSRAVWIPAGTWHQHRFYGRSSLHTVGFPAGDPAPSLASPSIIAVDALVRELLIACTAPDLPGDEAGRLRAVLHDRLEPAGVQALTLPTARDPRLADACRLVRADLRQPRSIDWLARSVGSSERTLTRLFRAEFGTTYPQWRTDVRVFQSLVWLSEGVDVTETAQRCGWATASAFIDTFARIVGQTPGAYRRAASTHQD